MPDSDDKPENEAEETETYKVGPVAAVLPLHAIPGIEAKRGRGRPRTVHPKPVVSDLAYHAEVAERRAKFIDIDAVVKAATSRQDAAEMLQRIKEETAREAASLHFNRVEAEKYGKDTTQISRNRIAALREIAALELEIKKMGVTVIDLKGERFQKIFALFMETIKEAAMETMTPEAADLFFNRLEASMDGWEEKAQVL